MNHLINQNVNLTNKIYQYNYIKQSPRGKQIPSIQSPAIKLKKQPKQLYLFSKHIVYILRNKVTLASLINQTRFNATRKNYQDSRKEYRLMN